MNIQISTQTNESSQVLPSEEDLCCSINTILADPLFLDLPEHSILSVVFVDDSTMQKINSQFRHQDRTTDVLSFEINEMTPEGYLWGEVLVSPQQAIFNAQEKQLSLYDEIQFLFIHALLHLKGFDHQTKEEANLMKRHELQLFKILFRGDD